MAIICLCCQKSNPSDRLDKGCKYCGTQLIYNNREPDCSGCEEAWDAYEVDGQNFNSVWMESSLL